MSTSIDWAKLVNEGRAKAIGIPWSDEELEALENGISPEDVRAGILSEDDYEEEEEEEKKLIRHTKEELMQKADEMGIEYEEDAVTRNALISEISQQRS